MSKHHAEQFELAMTPVVTPAMSVERARLINEAMTGLPLEPATDQWVRFPSTPSAGWSRIWCGVPYRHKNADRREVSMEAWNMIMATLNNDLYL